MEFILIFKLYRKIFDFDLYLTYMKCYLDIFGKILFGQQYLVFSRLYPEYSVALDPIWPKHWYQIESRSKRMSFVGHKSLKKKKISANLFFVSVYLCTLITYAHCFFFKLLFFLIFRILQQVQQQYKFIFRLNFIT